jgi:serine/threonine protein kinase
VRDDASARRAPLASGLETELAAAIRASPGRLLGQGYQASVHLYRTSIGDVVVKKPHDGALLGALWRSLLRREHAAYDRLGDVPGVPRCYGLIDGRYLALEYVEGPPLRGHDAALEAPERFLAELLATLRALHAAGVAHRDLKRKDNIIIGAGERPYLIDFGIASLRRGSRDRVFEHACQLDLNAWIKLKYGRRLDELSAGDAALYRPLLTERLARAIRVPWQTLTLRRPRQRWRRAREARRGAADARRDR